VRKSHADHSIRGSRINRIVLIFTAATLVVTGIGFDATSAHASQAQGVTQRSACGASTKGTPACTVTVGVLAWGKQGAKTGAAYTAGTWPPAGNYALTYSLGSSVPAGEETSVTGTLVCKTPANSNSPVGVYSITSASCSGLADTANTWVTISYNYNLSDQSPACKADAAVNPPTSSSTSMLATDCGSSYTVLPSIVCSANVSTITGVVVVSQTVNVVRIDYSPPLQSPPAVGSSITVGGIVPAAFDGTFTVTARDPSGSWVEYTDRAITKKSAKATLERGRIGFCPYVTVAITAAGLYGTDTNGVPVGTNPNAMNWLGAPPPVTTSVAPASSGASVSSLVGQSLSVGSTSQFPVRGVVVIVASGGNAELAYSAVLSATTLQISSFVSGTGTWTITAGSPVTAEGSVVTVLSASDGTDQSGKVNGDLSCGTTAAANGRSPVGSYSIVGCSGLSDPGYVLVYDYAKSWYKVQPAALRISVSPSNATIGLTSLLPNFAPNYSGLVAGNTPSTFGQAGNTPPTCAAPVTSGAGQYTTTCQGAVNPNYAITYVPGTLWISSTPSPDPDLMGSAVALSADGQTALVGAPGSTVNGKTDAGVVDVYSFTGGSPNPWTLKTVLSLDTSGGPGAAAGDRFGFSVALNGDGTQALVGTPGRTVDGGSNAGAAVVYSLSGNTWSFTKQLDLGASAQGGSWCPVSDLSDCGDELGFSVSMNYGNQVAPLEALVGAPFRHTTFVIRIPVLCGFFPTLCWLTLHVPISTGTAELFSATGGVWGSPVQLSQGRAAQWHQEFGYSVALNRDSSSDDGTIAVVGAPDTYPATAAGSCAQLSVDAGAVYLFGSNLAGGWPIATTQMGLGCAAREGDHLGWSVAVSSNGKFALAGAPDRSLALVAPDLTIKSITNLNNGTASITFDALTTSLSSYGDAVIISGATSGSQDCNFYGNPLGILTSTSTTATVDTSNTGSNCTSLTSTSSVGTGTILRSSAGAAELFNNLGSGIAATWTHEFNLACHNTITANAQSCGSVQEDQPLGQIGDRLGASVALSSSTAKGHTPSLLYALVGAPNRTINANVSVDGSGAGAAELFTANISQKCTACAWTTELSLGLDANAGSGAGNADGLASAVALAVDSGTDLLPGASGCAASSPPQWDPTALLGAPSRTITGTYQAGTAEFYTLNPKPFPTGCYWSGPPEEQSPTGVVSLPRSLVQLGDSVASGEGTLYGYARSPIPGYWWGSIAAALGFAPCGDNCGWTGPYPQCHQSSYAYGQQIAGALNAGQQPQATFLNLACTGASFDTDSNNTDGGITTPDEVAPEAPAEFGQWSSTTSADGTTLSAGSDLNHSYFVAAPNAVALTLGANDVQFSQLVQNCVEWDFAGWGLMKASDLASEFALFTPFPWDLGLAILAAILYAASFYSEQLHCTTGTPGSLWNQLLTPETSGGQIASNIALLTTWISERAQADMQPPPRIVVTGYENMLNRSGWCNDDWLWWIGAPESPVPIDPPITTEQRSHFIDDGLVGINNAVANGVAASAGYANNAGMVNYVPMYQPGGVDPFASREWCSDSPLGSIFEPAPWTYSLSTLSVQQEIAGLFGAPTSNAPFHPTPCGQTQFANAVGAQLTSDPTLGWTVPTMSCPSGEP